MTVSLLLLTAFLGVHDFSLGGEGTKFPYKLDKPAEQTVLPPILHEVSAITMIDNNTFACVQDENGVVFFYDIHKSEIVKQLAFSNDGDYEGIAKVGTSLYILRSDGALFEIPDMNNAWESAVYYKSELKDGDYEGLCYDQKEKRLLIAPKGEVEDENHISRVIYAFDLQAKRMKKKPVYQFNIGRVTQFAAKQGLMQPYRFTKKGKVQPNLTEFRTSEIALHPITGELYMLAAEDFMLYVFSREGIIKYARQLAPEIFNQAEGLTFFSNGDMLISNEGGAGKPTVLQFDYQP